MDYRLGYGKSEVVLTIDQRNLLYELHPNPVITQRTGESEVRHAMENPIHSKKLFELVRPGEKIAIITSDITRPMPSAIVLPFVIMELQKGGVKTEDILIVFALGCHRHHTVEEMKHIVGEEIFNEYKCVDSDSNDYVHLGFTKRGTPVDIFTPVAQADRRICLGNIEYHYFAGYSGGAKAIMPGVSTKAAIQENHSRMVMPKACAGKTDGNPVREDIEEVVDFVPIDFILNVILDENKNIIKAVAGHYLKAHREGCAFLDKIYMIAIPERADIVVVSPGGYPKDINLYQAQKALDNASHAVKNAGIIILAASCIEGLGEEVFERWMQNSTSSRQMIEKIQEKFELGGHKAAAIALVLQNARIFLISHMQDEFVKSIFLEPFDDMNSALTEAYRELGSDAKVILMPYGGSTLPMIKSNNA
jgi:nickel-dependent lactate racemase